MLLVGRAPRASLVHAFRVGLGCGAPGQWTAGFETITPPLLLMITVVTHLSLPAERRMGLRFVGPPAHLPSVK